MCWNMTIKRDRFNSVCLLECLVNDCHLVCVHLSISLASHVLSVTAVIVKI